MKEKLRNVITMEPPGWSPDSRICVSKLTVYSNEEVFIENFRHVIYSDDEKMSVKTRKGILSIYGAGLAIEYYSSYEIKINGRISSIDWLTE